MSTTHQIREILDADKIRASIDPININLLTTLDIFDSINSTNTYLLECAKSGGHKGWACFAEQQSKGKGRRGRVWFSPKGANIYCSLLWNVPDCQPDIPALSIAIAVMVKQALKKYGIEDVQLKWPNDILIAGRKLAGILLESLPSRNKSIPIVIGVGINLELPKDHPDPEMQKWIAIADVLDKPIERNHLAGLLLNKLLMGLNLFQEQGLTAFLDSWREADVLQGKSVLVHTALETIAGVFAGVSERGELILQKNEGDLQIFQCGEVSVRNN